MPNATVKSERIRLGPGKWWAAPLGTYDSTYAPTGAASLFTIGTDLMTKVPGDPDALAIGATEQGSQFQFSLTVEPVLVEESLDPVAYVSVGRDAKIALQMAQLNLTNYAIAFNAGLPSGGWTGTPAATTVAKFTPPVLGGEVRVQVLWISQTGDELYLFYQVLQGGQIQDNRRKGANKATLGVEFTAELPPSAVATVPWAKYVIGASWAVTVTGE